MQVPWQQAKGNPRIAIKTTAGAGGKVQSACFGRRLGVSTAPAATGHLQRKHDAAKIQSTTECLSKHSQKKLKT